MKAQIKWQSHDSGIEFSLTNEVGEFVPINIWGLHQVTTNDKSATVGPLLVLVEDEAYESCTETHVVISHANVAKFDDDEIKQIGLPPAAPCRLEIRGQ